MKKLAEKLVESMMKYGTLSNEDKGIYVFGIYQTMVSALEILLMLVTGILCGVGWQCVIFLVSFVVLRRYAGGYHASTLPRCVLMSWSIVFGAPIEDSHKKLYDYEIQKYWRYSLIILGIYSIIYVFLWMNEKGNYAQCIVIGNVMVMMVMIMSMPWRKLNHIFGRKKKSSQ